MLLPRVRRWAHPAHPIIDRRIEGLISAVCLQHTVAACNDTQQFEPQTPLEKQPHMRIGGRLHECKRPPIHRSTALCSAAAPSMRAAGKPWLELATVVVVTAATRDEHVPGEVPDVERHLTLGV